MKSFIIENKNAQNEVVGKQTVSTGSTAHTVVFNLGSQFVAKIDLETNKLVLNNENGQFDSISTQKPTIVLDATKVKMDAKNDLTFTVDGKATYKITGNAIIENDKPVKVFDGFFDVELPTEFFSDIENGKIDVTSFPFQMFEALEQSDNIQKLTAAKGKLNLVKINDQIYIGKGSQLIHLEKNSQNYYAFGSNSVIGFTIGGTKGVMGNKVAGIGFKGLSEQELEEIGKFIEGKDVDIRAKFKTANDLANQDIDYKRVNKQTDITKKATVLTKGPDDQIKRAEQERDDAEEAWRLTEEQLKEAEEENERLRNQITDLEKQKTTDGTTGVTKTDDEIIEDTTDGTKTDDEIIEDTTDGTKTDDEIVEDTTDDSKTDDVIFVDPLPETDGTKTDDEIVEDTTDDTITDSETTDEVTEVDEQTPETEITTDDTTEEVVENDQTQTPPVDDTLRFTRRQTPETETIEEVEETTSEVTETEEVQEQPEFIVPQQPVEEQEQTDVEETPTEETPTEETPAEENPAEETPAEETPAEETPAEETPVQEEQPQNQPQQNQQQERPQQQEEKKDKKEESSRKIMPRWGSILVFALGVAFILAFILSAGGWPLLFTGIAVLGADGVLTFAEIKETKDKTKAKTNKRTYKKLIKSLDKQNTQTKEKVAQEIAALQNSLSQTTQLLANENLPQAERERLTGIKNTLVSRIDNLTAYQREMESSLASIKTSANEILTSTQKEREQIDQTITQQKQIFTEANAHLTEMLSADSSQLTASIAAPEQQVQPQQEQNQDQPQQEQPAEQTEEVEEPVQAEQPEQTEVEGLDNLTASQKEVYSKLDELGQCVEQLETYKQTKVSVLESLNGNREFLVQELKEAKTIEEAEQIKVDLQVLDDVIDSFEKVIDGCPTYYSDAKQVFDAYMASGTDLSQEQDQLNADAIFEEISEQVDTGMNLFNTFREHLGKYNEVFERRNGFEKEGPEHQAQQTDEPITEP